MWINEEEANKFTGVTDLQVVEDATQKAELNKAQEIKIRFVTNTDEVHNGSKATEWLTHPAFTTFNSNGMWVGKFETSKNGNVDDDSISPEAVQIKPGVTSWRSIRAAHAFYTTYGYQRELESHMMKNTEWGAVAYLTNSVYGRCDENGNCTEVRINNSNRMTGYSAVNEPTCGFTNTNISCNQWGNAENIVNSYSNPASVASSTTNNYYGVFDMAGGSHEYVMGVMADNNEKPVSGADNTQNSNFVGALTYPQGGTDTTKTTWTTADGGLPWPDSKYYDTYGYDMSDQNFQRGLLGDGTKEFGQFFEIRYPTGNESQTYRRVVNVWNVGTSFFVYSTHPWFRRGGDFPDGTDTGVSSFDHLNGSQTNAVTFRVVLTP